MRIRFGKRFGKQYDKAPQEVKTAFDRRLKIFSEDRYNPLLNNHPLGRRLKGYRSINITGDWRAIYREFEEEEEDLIFFDALGTHSQLYG